MSITSLICNIIVFNDQLKVYLHFRFVFNVYQIIQILCTELHDISMFIFGVIRTKMFIPSIFVEKSSLY